MAEPSLCSAATRATVGLPSCPERFKRNALDMSQLVLELITFCNQRGYQSVDTNLVQLTILVLTNKRAEDLIEIFINHSHMHWSNIRQRDEVFFINNAAQIFADNFNTQRVNAFQVLFTATTPEGQPVIGRDDRDSIWDYFDSLVRISINHIHEQRQPLLRMIGSQPVADYQASYFDNIDLAAMAASWGIKLDWSTSPIAI